jgi:hypothetical protein
VDFYVVAFAGEPMPRRRIEGRWYEAMPLDRIFAIGERRTRPPEATDSELRHQHAVVAALAERFDAILPVRFGAMSSTGMLVEMSSRLAGPLAAGLEEVRGKAQMTVRFIGEPRPIAPAATPARSGRDYLLRKQAAAAPELPADAVAWLGPLRALAVRERVEPGAGSVLATVYHLVPQGDLDRYKEAALQAPPVGARVTGPFAPFAFTPTVL